MEPTYAKGVVQKGYWQAKYTNHSSSPHTARQWQMAIGKHPGPIFQVIKAFWLKANSPNKFNLKMP